MKYLIGTFGPMAVPLLAAVKDHQCDHADSIARKGWVRQAEILTCSLIFDRFLDVAKELGAP